MICYGAIPDMVTYPGRCLMFLIRFRIAGDVRNDRVSEGQPVPVLKVPLHL